MTIFCCSAKKDEYSQVPVKRVSMINEYPGKSYRLLNEYELINEYEGTFIISVNEYDVINEYWGIALDVHKRFQKLLKSISISPIKHYIKYVFFGDFFSPIKLQP